MKANRMLMWVVAGILAMTAIDAAAQPRGKGKRGMGRRNLMAQLDLTADQQEKVKAIRLENAKKMARIQADVKVASLELREVMAQDVPSAGEVKAKLKAVSEPPSRMMESRINTQLAMKKILTPEQRQKMKELRKQRPNDRRGKWREGRGRRGNWQGRGQGRGQMPPPHPGF